MNLLFDNDILNLPEVHDLLKDPRDLSKEEFHYLCIFDNVNMQNIIECRKISSAFMDLEILSSQSDFRRKINSLKVGTRTILDANDEFFDDEFFETGIEGLRWISLLRGKKKQCVGLIWEDKLLEDPWFGLSYEDWKTQKYR